MKFVKAKDVDPTSANEQKVTKNPRVVNQKEIVKNPKANVTRPKAKGELYLRTKGVLKLNTFVIIVEVKGIRDRIASSFKH